MPICAPFIALSNITQHGTQPTIKNHVTKILSQCPTATHHHKPNCLAHLRKVIPPTLTMNVPNVHLSSLLDAQVRYTDANIMNGIPNPIYPTPVNLATLKCKILSLPTLNQLIAWVQALLTQPYHPEPSTLPATYPCKATLPQSSPPMAQQHPP